MNALAPILEVRGIETRFGKTKVHSDVSFTISQPSVVALIGGSGSGKSVLLREIIGLLRPSAGSVRLYGVDMWNSSEEDVQKVRERIGVLFQNGALFSAITVRENVATPLRETAELPERLIAAIVELRLALSGLPLSAAHKMPSELSGGMIKRAALARALALEPKILFLDEPTSGLDPINAGAFDSLVRTLCDNLRITILVITHDLDTLRSAVDRIIVLGEGRVLADGTPEQVEGVDHPWIKEYFSARKQQHGT